MLPREGGDTKEPRPKTGAGGGGGGGGTGSSVAAVASGTRSLPWPPSWPPRLLGTGGGAHTTRRTRGERGGGAQGMEHVGRESECGAHSIPIHQATPSPPHPPARPGTAPGGGEEPCRPHGTPPRGGGVTGSDRGIGVGGRGMGVGRAGSATCSWIPPPPRPICALLLLPAPARTLSTPQEKCRCGRETRACPWACRAQSESESAS